MSRFETLGAFLATYAVGVAWAYALLWCGAHGHTGALLALLALPGLALLALAYVAERS
jgi:hypothetical protein